MLIRMFDVYEKVIDLNQRRSWIGDETIADAIQLILDSYSNEGLKASPNAIDFNLPQIRCAYVYLYCTSHSHLVYSSLACFRMESERALFEWLWERQRCPKQLLSIGGGPGSDLIGLLLFLQPFISNDTVRCQIVDAYEGWADVLMDTLESLEMQRHYRDMTFGYKEVDLLRPMSEEMLELLRGADFVTISKFVSAISADMSAARRLRCMLQVLRPGTLVYFVDNAGGEAFRLGERVAASCGLVPVWGPVYHFDFRVPKNMEPMSEVLACPRFGGVRPQTSSKVSIVVWKKMDTPPRGLKRTMSVGSRHFGHAPLPHHCDRTKIVARRRMNRCPVPDVPRRPQHAQRARTYSLRRTPARIMQRQHHRRVFSLPPTMNGPHLKELTNLKVTVPRGALTPYSMRQLGRNQDCDKTVELETPKPAPPILGLMIDVSRESGLSAKKNNRRNVQICSAEDSENQENRSSSTPYKLRNLSPQSSRELSQPIAKKMRF